MQMEQIEDQKTISYYREEHSNSLRNELRNKFIQKSREKHFKRNQQMDNRLQLQIKQQLQGSLIDNTQSQNHLYQSNNTNSSNMSQNYLNSSNPLNKFSQDVIIEENYYENRQQNNHNFNQQIQNATQSQLIEELKYNQNKNQIIQSFNFQTSVQVLLNNNDPNIKLLLLQHITEIVDHNIQDLMDFSFVLQNHNYLLDMIKNYIEQNQKNNSPLLQSPTHLEMKLLNGNKSGENSHSSHSNSLNDLEGDEHQNNKLIWAINLISLIAYTKQENVVGLINKGFVDTFINIYMEHNQNIKIAEKIISFFANVISVNETMKTIILNNIPIKLFLFFFSNNEYHQPIFLDFHQILSLFLNKCYLQSDYNDIEHTQDDNIMHSLMYVFNSVIKDFLTALQNFITDAQISINISEILTFICSNILKTYPIEIIKQHLIDIKQLIQLQIKSGYKPLQIQSIKLMSKIFQIPNILQEFDDETKGFFVQTLKDSLHCEMKQIRLSSITTIINLLQNLHDDQQYTHIIQFLYHNIFDRFENDNIQIKLLCLDFFQSVIKHCSISWQVSVDWKLKMGDQILVSLIQQLKKCDLSTSNSQFIDFILKILNLLSSIITILNSDPFKHKFEFNYFQDSGLFQVLNLLQQQDISFEIKNQACLIIQLFYSVQNQK